MSEDQVPVESQLYDTGPQFSPYSPDLDQDSDGVETAAPQEQPETGPPLDPQAERDQAPLPTFDPKYREDFEGLLYLGRLQSTCTRWGHQFVLRTLTTEHLATIGMLTKPYAGSVTEMAVYQSAYVAAAVVSVDDQELPRPLSMDASVPEVMDFRLKYVMKSWLPAVREWIYDQAYLLEVRAREVLDEMGKASG